MSILPDIQENKPEISIALNRVGISKLILPVFISSRDNYGDMHTIADISCYVDLVPDKKGINMSRLPIIIQSHINTPLNNQVVQHTCEEVRLKSQAEICYLTYKFKYFIEKLSPVTNLKGILDHTVLFEGISKQDDFNWKISVETIGTSLCPCSKEISNYGAHNQKCYITIEVEPVKNNIIWIEDLIEIANKSCSCEIFSILKRSDEKYVTETAYNNPMFVEDVTRKVYQFLSNNKKINNFHVRVASDESIHVHRAEAIIEGSNYG